MINASEPRILLYDIETGKGYAKVPFYQLKQYSQYINPDYVERSVWMVCAAWKWLGQPYVASTSVLNDPERFKNCYWDDYHVVKTLHDLISECDILVAHNGDNFDWKMFRGRCLFHGLIPPPVPLMIDTLKIARKEFKFDSNALRFLAKHLNVTDKAESPDWDGVYNGDPEAIKYCEEYNRQDIRTLEGVYLKLRPYATNHANLNAILTGVHHHTCPKCSHWDQEARGYRYTKAGKYQQYRCRVQTGGCGGWSQNKKNLKEVTIR